MACNCNCHASRDPEVARHIENLKDASLRADKYEATIKRLREELSTVREDISSWKDQYFKAVERERQAVKASQPYELALEVAARTAAEMKLKAEREASRKLVEAVRDFLDGMGDGPDDSDVAHLFKRLREALVTATPGHSPEGKTL